jgi:tryptophan-rich sensory protein
MMSKVTFVIMFALLIIIFGPIVAIWSLNTLFPVLVIPYTLETWFATAIVMGVIRGDSTSFKGK